MYGAAPPRFDRRFRNRLAELAFFASECLLISLCSPKGPGPMMRLVFKSGVLFYRVGLEKLVSGVVLLLTTTGRKTHRPRVTPLDYRYEPAADTYYIVAGWGEHSDWVRNLKANPSVHVRVGSREFDAVAILKTYLVIAPIHAIIAVVLVFGLLAALFKLVRLLTSS